MFNLLIEVLPAVILLTAAFVLLNHFRFHNGMRTVAYTLFAIYLAAVYSLVGLPTILFTTFEVTLNLIPLVGMIADCRNAVLNVLLFIPLGFFLPLLWSAFSTQKRTLLFGLEATVSIELLQLLTFRVTDINDIITNFLGTWLGFLVYGAFRRLFVRLLVPEQRTNDLFLILGVVAAVMYFLHPIIASAIYKLT